MMKRWLAPQMLVAVFCASTTMAQDSSATKSMPFVRYSGSSFELDRTHNYEMTLRPGASKKVD